MQQDNWVIYIYQLTSHYTFVQILENAAGALKDHDRVRVQWALELSTHVLHASPANGKAKELRTQALLSTAAKQTSASARNYLLTYILQDHGIMPKRYPVSQTALDVALETVFKRMAFCIKAEAVEAVSMTVVIKFKDLDRIFSLCIRNCILEVGSCLFLEQGILYASFILFILQ